MLTLDYTLTSQSQGISMFYEGIYAEMVYANKFNENSDFKHDIPRTDEND